MYRIDWGPHLYMSWAIDVRPYAPSVCISYCFAESPLLRCDLSDCPAPIWVPCILCWVNGAETQVGAGCTQVSRSGLCLVFGLRDGGEV